MQRIWKDYSEDLYNIETQEHIAVHMYGMDGVQRGNYFGGTPSRRTEVGVSVRQLKNRKDKVTGEIIKGGGDMVVEWIWRLCYMTFESCVMPEDLRSAMMI